MPELRVRTDRGDLSGTFNLGTFITDWKAARNTFMAHIRDGFRDLTSPRPSDFSAASSADLGEAWSKYRIFGGSSTVLLRARVTGTHFPEHTQHRLPGRYQDSAPSGGSVVACARGVRAALVFGGLQLPRGDHRRPLQRVPRTAREPGDRGRSESPIGNGVLADARIQADKPMTGTECFNAGSSSPTP